MALSRKLMPSLQELTAFEAAARHASFTMAADELSLTQSAVSKQIRQLEETLGVILFDRTKGRVVLTTLGERYMRSARRILRDYETETHAIVASAGSETTLRIAVLPTFASRWLIPRLPEFLARHPSLAVSMTSEPRPFDFAEKPVDIAIHYGAASWPHAEATYLCKEGIVAVASPQLAAELGLRKASDLVAAPLIQQAERPSLWKDWFDFVGTEHSQPYRGVIFDQFAMTSEAAVAGLGVALAPTFLVERELQTQKLVALNEPPFPGSGAYYVVTPLGKQHNPAVAAFIEWISAKTRGTASSAPAQGR